MTSDGGGGGTSGVSFCNGNGRSLSMAELAVRATDNGDAVNYTYGLDPNNPYTWDAHKIFGCLCDNGYEGYDCSLRCNLPFRRYEIIIHYFYLYLILFLQLVQPVTILVLTMTIQKCNYYSV
jgi:hypothetical protein